MYRKGTKFYADWFDISGVRHRRSFATANAALAHESRESVLKSAIFVGRRLKAVEFWQNYGLIEQPLRALTDTVGWMPFGFEEIDSCINELCQMGRAPARPHIGVDGQADSRGAVLRAILSGFVHESREAESMIQPRRGGLA